ncbi:hypothetical protein GGC63_004160 [Paenibacillus sp. OAS669]|nr:hypothetical protein [Paenibacillus sp. OAS669]
MKALPAPAALLVKASRDKGMKNGKSPEAGLNDHNRMYRIPRSSEVNIRFFAVCLFGFEVLVRFDRSVAFH